MRSQRSAVVMRTRAPAGQSIDIASNGRSIWIQADDHLWYEVTCVQDQSKYIIRPSQSPSIPKTAGAGKPSWIASDGNSYSLSLIKLNGTVQFGPITKSNAQSRFKSSRLVAGDGTVVNLGITSDQGTLTYQLT